jgi:hypothetical protein
MYQKKTSASIKLGLLTSREQAFDAPQENVFECLN